MDIVCFHAAFAIVFRRVLNGAAGSEWMEYMPNEPHQLVLELVIPVLFLALMLVGRSRASLAMYLVGTLPVLLMLCIWTLYIWQMAHGRPYRIDAPLATGLWLLLTAEVIRQQIQTPCCPCRG